MRAASYCVLAAGILVAPPSAWARTQVLETQAGSVVHWNARAVAVGVDIATTPVGLDRLDVVLAMERAIRVWNRIPADQPRLRLTTDADREVVVRFCRGAWQGDAIDLGRTQFEASPRDGRVTAATVELNACDHTFAVAADETAGRFDLQSVLSHELGHVLGLGHSDDRAAIMFPSGRGLGTRVPTADDERALAVIYLGRERAVAPPTPPPAAMPETTATQSVPDFATSPTTGTGPPADSVSVMNVKSSGGRQLTIYTGEPSLLPPIADVPDQAQPRVPRKAAHPRPKLRR